MLETISLAMVVLGGGAAVVAWRSHNRLAMLDARCEAAFADVDVLLKQRHDLIPNLVETVRAFAGQERRVLTEVIEARSRALAAGRPEIRMEAEEQLGQCITSLLDIAERYPTLASSSHFADLRNELTQTEMRIANARRFLNITVAEFRATSRQFPAALFADKMMLGNHQTFSLGRERVLLDEPVTVRF